MDPNNFINNNGKYMFMNLNYIDGIPVDVINNGLSGRRILDGKGQAFFTRWRKI